MSLYSYKYQQPQTLVIQSDQRIRKLLIRSAATLASLFLVLLTSLLLNNLDGNHVFPISASTPNEVPMSRRDEVGTNTLTPTPYQLDSTWSQDGNVSDTLPTPTVTISTNKLVTVAVIGDSLVDTMGEVLEYLDSALKKKYPQTKFLLYNYGIGAQNVEAGLNRFTTHFSYQTRDYPSLPELKPDILIVGSFAYNPFTPHDRDRHWLALTKLVEQAKTVTSNIYLLAEIAPLRKDFGKGNQGVNWSDETNHEHSGRIIEQLQNAVGLSRSLNVPLIDAFTPSFNSTSQEGNRAYVNPADGIHPSVEGHQFMAEKITQTLMLP